MPDNPYVIESALKTLLVLEALEGTRFEAVSLKRIQERTKLPLNFCFRALQTLKELGYARETERGWALGGRLLLFSEEFNRNFAALASEIPNGEFPKHSRTDSKALN